MSYQEWLASLNLKPGDPIPSETDYADFLITQQPAGGLIDFSTAGEGLGTHLGYLDSQNEFVAHIEKTYGIPYSQWLRETQAKHGESNWDIVKDMGPIWAGTAALGLGAGALGLLGGAGAAGATGGAAGGAAGGATTGGILGAASAYPTLAPVIATGAGASAAPIAAGLAGAGALAATLPEITVTGSQATPGMGAVSVPAAGAFANTRQVPYDHSASGGLLDNLFSPENLMDAGKGLLGGGQQPQGGGAAPMMPKQFRSIIPDVQRQSMRMRPNKTLAEYAQMQGLLGYG